ncbi:MAG: tetratricopeptide repeat protein [Maricaulaceae bacterium]
MVDFINEVEEELRKDEYNRLLKRYGPLLVGIVIAVVAATAFMEWRKSADDKAARAVSIAYVNAGQKATDGNVSGAISDFKAIADQAPDGYAGLSLMRAAGLHVDAGERQEAITMFDQAAARFSHPRHSQLAELKAAYILAGDGQYDDVRARLAKLATKDQPYEYLARELLGFAAMQSDDLPAAREQFSYLDNIPGVMPSVKERASQYLSLMNTDMANAAVLEDNSPDITDLDEAKDGSDE